MFVLDNELTIYGYSRIRAESRQVTRFRKGVGFAGHIWATGRPDICNNVNEDPRFVPSGLEHRSYESILGIPIYNNGEVVGVICVQDSKSDAFYNEDITLVRSYIELLNLFVTLHIEAENAQIQTLSNAEVAITAEETGGNNDD